MRRTLRERAPEAVTAALAAVLGLVVTLVAALGTGGLAALLGAGGGTVQVTVLAVLVVGLLATAGTGLAAWLAVGWLRGATAAARRGARRWLLDTARAVERAVPAAERLGLSARLAREEDRLAALKRRYVDGVVDEREFERELERLLADAERADVRAVLADLVDERRAAAATDERAADAADHPADDGAATAAAPSEPASEPAPGSGSGSGSGTGSNTESDPAVERR